MSDEQSRTKPQRPAGAEVAPVRVVETVRLSDGFVRLTLTGSDDALERTFEAMGFDQWFRLFLPRPGQSTPELPSGAAEGWYQRWLAVPEDRRPVLRNYTVREARREASGWQLDVDFVVHRHPGTGAVEGAAARWALAARPGDRAGLLDQGIIIDVTAVRTAERLVVVTDETGLPGAEGIARSLPPGTEAVFVVETPPGDGRELPSAGRVQVLPVARPAGEAPGRRALDVLREVDLGAGDYVYAVGEAALARDARAAARAAGVPDERVDFCAYWRPGRRRAAG